MVNATFAYQKTGGVNILVNATCLLLSFYMFAKIFARSKFVQIPFFSPCFTLELLMKLFYMFTGLLSYHCLFLFSAFLTS